MFKQFFLKQWCLLVCSVFLLQVLIGCGETPTPQPTSSSKQQFRIVSLSPAITQMVHDLGLAESVVGRTSYDDLADPALPVVGDVFNLEYETLLSLEPTHVLVQAGAKGVPARLQGLAAEKDWIIWSAPLNRATDVSRAMVGGGEQMGLGVALGLGDRAKVLVEEMEGKLASIRKASAAPLPERKRVLLLVSTDPIMAAGQETFLDDLLTIAGGTNAWTEAAVAYPTLDKETVLGLQADLVIVIQRGDRMSPTVAEAIGVDPERTAIKMLNDPAALKPTTTLVRTAEQLQKLIAPSTKSP